jgi:hypothetical protein
MAVEEHRRIALHRAASESWGEEVADTLVDMVVPPGDVPAGRADVQAVRAEVDALRTDLALMEHRWDERFAAADQRWDERLAVMDQRWDLRMEALEHRMTATFERRIADAVNTQTKTLVFSQLGAVVVIAGLAFGLQ